MNINYSLSDQIINTEQRTISWGWLRKNSISKFLPRRMEVDLLKCPHRKYLRFCGGILLIFFFSIGLVVLWLSLVTFSKKELLVSQIELCLFDFS